MAVWNPSKVIGDLLLHLPTANNTATELRRLRLVIRPGVPTESASGESCSAVALASSFPI